MVRFGEQQPNGLAVQQLEVLVRTAVFESANGLVGFLLQEAANRIDANYQAKAGQAQDQVTGSSGDVRYLLP